MSNRAQAVTNMDMNSAGKCSHCFFKNNKSRLIVKAGLHSYARPGAQVESSSTSKRKRMVQQILCNF